MKPSPQAKTAANSNAFTLAALIQAFRVNAVKRPLWKLSSAADFLDVDTDQIAARIEDGRFPYAFDISIKAGRSRCARVLALSVIEERFGPHPTIGATRKLKLKDVIDLILPPRPNIRSTELPRRFSCSPCQARMLRGNFKITRKPLAMDGPHSFFVFSRASIAAWLASRRVI